MWCFFCPPHRLFTDLGPWDIKSSPHPIEFLAERRRGVWKWLKAFSSWEGIKGRLEIVDRRTALWLFSLGPLRLERRIRGWEVKGRTRWLIGPRQQVSTGQLNQTQSRIFPPTTIRYIIWLCQHFCPAGCSTLIIYTCAHEEGHTQSQKYTLTHEHIWNPY